MKKKRSTNSSGSMPKGFGWPKDRRRAAAKALREARCLLEERGELATGELAWDAEGREVPPTSIAAQTWCSLGAICYVTDSPAYGAEKPMKRQARDAMFVLGKLHMRHVRSTGEAASAVYDLNDGRDTGSPGFGGMSLEAHFKHVLDTFEKAEKALR